MTYYSNMDRELTQAGIQEGELALYTGTVNPRQAGTLSPDTNSKNTYTYHWRDGQSVELCACFWQDSAGLDVLEAQVGEDTYIFLRDEPSGYIRQVSGPAKPITVANLGLIPLRADTLLGRFTVYAGAILRLDASVPQREKKTVLLTVSSERSQPLASAELWDGSSWQRLNICEEPASVDGDRGLAVKDGSAIVQYVTVNRSGELLMADAPEPDPEFEIYITGQGADRTVLRFNRTDYQKGRVVQRVRTVSFHSWGAPVVYDLRKLRESCTAKEVRQCRAKLPGLPAEREPLPALDGDGFPDFPSLTDLGALAPAFSGDDAAEWPDFGTESVLPGPEAQEAPVPEAPEDFPD